MLRSTIGSAGIFTVANFVAFYSHPEVDPAAFKQRVPPSSVQMQDNATMSNPANAGRLSTTTTSKPNDRQLRPRRKPVTYAYALEDTDFDGLEHHMAAWSQYAQPQNAQPQPQYAQPAAAISQTSALPHIRQPDSRESNLWPAPIFFAPFSDSPTEVEMRLV